jgi:hypothetical protein
MLPVESRRADIGARGVQDTRSARMMSATTRSCAGESGGTRNEEHCGYDTVTAAGTQDESPSVIGVTANRAAFPDPVPRVRPEQIRGAWGSAHREQEVGAGLLGFWGLSAVGAGVESFLDMVSGVIAGGKGRSEGTEPRRKPDNLSKARLAQLARVPH